jgi:hypothetical protein
MELKALRGNGREERKNWLGPGQCPGKDSVCCVAVRLKQAVSVAEFLHSFKECMNRDDDLHLSKSWRFLIHSLKECRKCPPQKQYLSRPDC